MEEPFVLSTLVSFFKLCSYHVPGLLFLHWILQDFLVQVGLVECQVHGIPGGHHMVVVNNLNLKKTIKSKQHLIMHYNTRHLLIVEPSVFFLP